MVATPWLRIRRPAILVTEQKLQQKWAPSCRINSQHGDDISSEIATSGRDERRGLQLLLPAAVAAIDRLQLAPGRIVQDLGPDQFRFRLGEAHSAAVQQRSVAGHDVRPADDRLAAVLSRISRKIQCPVELMALHPHQG